MDEHGFIRYVHSKLDPQLVKWKIHDQFAGGVPDAYYLGAKGPLWVEYKYLKALPKRELSPVRTCLTEGQKIWLNDLERCKQPCALVIGHENRAVILQHGRWNTDVTRHCFVHNTVSRLQLVDWIHNTCL